MAGPEVSDSGEMMVRANGADLCVQAFGEPDDPAVLLIMGASASMDWWEDEFCRRLAAVGRYVIRYDSRDTGRSVTYPRGAPGYSARDLREDTMGVLDALGVDRAHVVGLSMGGAIAQVATLAHPGRVATLTLIATTAGGDGLPGPTAALSEWFEHSSEPPDPPEREATVEYLVDAHRAHAAPSRTFDADAVRATARRAYDRTRDMLASPRNLAAIDGGEEWRERLGELQMPVLVLHGREDPLFPPPHAVALARAIPGARLVWLDAMGHELPPNVWAQAIAEIAQHTSR